MYAAVQAVQVPWLSVADVLVEQQRLVLRQDTDCVDAGINAVGEREINDAVLAAERNGGLCQLLVRAYNLEPDRQPAAWRCILSCFSPLAGAGTRRPILCWLPAALGAPGTKGGNAMRSFACLPVVLRAAVFLAGFALAPRGGGFFRRRPVRFCGFAAGVRRMTALMAARAARCCNQAVHGLLLRAHRRVVLSRAAEFLRVE
jgi:hypothetical protein